MSRAEFQSMNGDTGNQSDHQSDDGDIWQPGQPSGRGMPQFNVNDNAMYEYERRKLCLVHVTDYNYITRRYNLYCPDDGEAVLDVDEGKLKALTCAHPPPKRNTMINAVFECDGDKWKVRSLQTRKNEYRCVRITGPDSAGPNVDDFDVIRRVISLGHFIREQGPRYRSGSNNSQILSSRLRTRRLRWL